LQNTAIVGAFLFTVLFPVIAADVPLKSVAPKLPLRIAGLLGCAVLFVVAVALPYTAEWQFQTGRRAKSTQQAYESMTRAISLNPYQPYYAFAMIRPLVATRAPLSDEQWLGVITQLQNCIKLNPLDATFLVYQAKVFRILNDKMGDAKYYNQAVESYLRATELSPYDVFQRAELAYYLYSSKRLDAAQQQLVMALDLEPAFLNARLLLAQILYQKGETSSAAFQLRSIRKLEKRFALEKANPLNGYMQRLLEVNTEQQKILEELVTE
jgi:tetratricopeptide (TPR) repeat protein